MYEILNNPAHKIKTAIIGMGAMGKGLLYQCRITPVFDCVAVSDINLQKAVEAARSLNIGYEVVDTVSGLENAVRRGLLAVTQDSDLIAESPLYDCLIESTNTIIDAARYSISALNNGKHLILMNAEVDLAFGPYLMDLAHSNGVVCTSCDGDQHTVISRMIRDIRLWGFDIVMAGNIKGFLDRYSNPEKIVPEADKRNLDYKMCTAYTDGTKLNIEMSLIANGLGFVARTPGMYGPEAKSVHETLQLFDLEGWWKDRQGSVDYLLGAEPNGGVFVIGHQDHAYQRSMLHYYKMGNGPFYLFYRPYHLCHVESLLCVAEAVHGHETLLAPTRGFVTNVYAYAKKDLKAGDMLDGIGGFSTYGMIGNCTSHEIRPALPVCLSENLVLRRCIEKDEIILLEDVEYDPRSYAFDLFHKSLIVSDKCRT